ncbi:hypothetical protein JXR93_00715 [bacterium]|nr:hypothetical protein [bacterium]
MSIFKNMILLILLAVSSTSCSAKQSTPEEQLESYFLKHGADLKYQKESLDLYISQKKFDKAFKVFVNTEFLSIKKDKNYNREMLNFIFDSIKDLSKKEQLYTIEQVMPVFTEITPLLEKRAEILAEGSREIDAWIELEKIYQLDSNIKTIGKKILFYDIKNHLRKNSGIRYITLISKIHSDESREFMKEYLTNNPSDIRDDLEINDIVFDEKYLLNQIKTQNYIQKKSWITQSIVQKVNLDEIKKIFEKAELPLKFYIYYEYRRVLGIELGEDFLKNLLKESSFIVKKAAFETIFDFKDSKYLQDVLDEINEFKITDENESLLFLLFKTLTIIDKNSGEKYIKLFESKIGEKKLSIDDYKLIREELKYQFSLKIDKDLVENLVKSEIFFISERAKKLIEDSSKNSEKHIFDKNQLLKKSIIERKKLKSNADFINWYEEMIIFLNNLN